MVLRIEEGKGAKDRYVMLSPRLLAVLHSYYRALRPPKDGHLFPSWRPGPHITTSSLSQACRDVAAAVGKGPVCGVGEMRRVQTLPAYRWPARPPDSS